MSFLRLLPMIISALLLAAHFLRAGLLGLVFVSLTFPALLLFRLRWTTWAVQVILVLGALEWLRTAIDLIDERRAAGDEWIIAAIILLVVAAVTLMSAFTIRGYGANRRERRPKQMRGERHE